MNMLRTPASEHTPSSSRNSRNLGRGALAACTLLLVAGCSGESYTQTEAGEAAGIAGGTLVQVHGVDPKNTQNLILEVCPPGTAPNQDATKFAEGCAPVSVHSVTLAINTQGVPPKDVSTYVFKAGQMISTNPDSFIPGTFAS